jgi:hypothetical protein
MSEGLQMFQTLMQSFIEEIPRSVWGDVRRLVVLAWAVVGLCLSKTVNFSAWGEYVESSARQAASRERRFHRWFEDPHMNMSGIYPPLVKVAMKSWQVGKRVYVALDPSVISGTAYVLVKAALIYRGRAIPLAWRIFEHDSATVGYKDYQPVLEAVHSCLPEGLEIVLLADRGFVHANLFSWLHEHGWHYRIRLTGDTLVRLNGHQVEPIAVLRPAKGEVCFCHTVYLLGEGIGPVHLALAQLDEPKAEPWYVASDELTDVVTLDEFGLRFDIEESFLDEKSNGFQLESSKLASAAAMEQLFLVIAIATLHCTSVGAEVVKIQCRQWVDAHWRRGMSYLKIGWSWLRQQIRRSWPVLPAFGLDPAPDPEPAIASLRKARQLKPTWRVVLVN